MPILSILVIVVVVGLIVIIHEVGHFIAAKLMGVGVEEFGIGFGKTLYEKEYKGTTYKINLFPIGGYVKLVGENDRTEGEISAPAKRTFFNKARVLIASYRVTEEVREVSIERFTVGVGRVIVERPIRGIIHQLKLVPIGFFIKMTDEEESGRGDNAYRSKPLWRKAVILLAGITMNIFLAVFLLFIYLSANSFSVDLPNMSPYDFSGTKDVQEIFVFPISEVMSGYPAEGKVNTGEILLQVNGNYLSTAEEFISTLEANQNTTVTLGLHSSNQTRTTIVDKEVEVSLPAKIEGEPLLGAAYSPVSVYLISYEPNIFSAFSHSWNLFGYQLAAIGGLAEKAIAESEPGYITDNVGGVVAVGGMINTLVNASAFLELINLTALVSLSLAAGNLLLPISVLDGGQLVLEVFQTIRRRPLSEKTVGILNLIGIILMMLLTVLITAKDIWQYGIVADILHFFQTALGR